MNMIKKIIDLTPLLFLFSAIWTAGCTTSDTSAIEDSYEVVLSADKQVIKADGTDAARLTLHCNGMETDTECEFFLAASDEKLTDARFVSSETGVFELYALYKGKYKSNLIRVEAVELSLLLSSSTTRFVADGEEKVTFRVTHDDADITPDCKLYVVENDREIPLSEAGFSTTQSGTYTIGAIYRGHRSNVVVLEALPLTIELRGSAAVIQADGREEVRFTVMRGDTDITAESRILLLQGERETPVEQAVFRTRQAGKYLFRADYKHARSETFEVEAQVAGLLFARGVTKESGWYDVNKKKDGRGADGLLCWAASCANALQWWQDNYVREGNRLPAGTPDGPGKEWELAIFEEFMSRWNNLGGSSYIGFRWYFTGQNDAASFGKDMFAQPTPGSGAYLKEVYERIKDRWGKDYSIPVSGYSTWDNGSGKTEDALAIFSRLIIQALKEGIVVLAINPGYTSSHAVTLWGCEYDENGLVRYLYITDSDDLIHNSKAPRKPVLHRFEVSKSPKEERVVGFKGMRYKDFVEIQNFDTLRGVPPMN